MAIATAVGVVTASIWAMQSKSSKREWDRLNKEYQLKKAERRKAFQSWLEAQPYDDEVLDKLAKEKAE